MVIDRRKTHTKHTRRHNITTVRQPERKRPEAAVIDPKGVQSTSRTKTVSLRFGGLHVVGQAGRMVVKERRHMITYAKIKSKAGAKVDGLWTAKSGHAEKP